MHDLYLVAVFFIMILTPCLVALDAGINEEQPFTGEPALSELDAETAEIVPVDLPRAA